MRQLGGTGTITVHKREALSAKELGNLQVLCKFDCNLTVQASWHCCPPNPWARIKVSLAWVPDWRGRGSPGKLLGNCGLAP